MRQEFLTNYDDRFREIPHLAAYPSLMPFIGKHYEAHNHLSMLLIGESYYFPKDSTIHLDADRWYGGTEKDLTDREVSYMNCRGLVGGGWEGKGHVIFREINRCLEEVAIESTGRGISHIAFMNAFFRPAEGHGDSFRHGCTELDRKKSMEITNEVLRVIEPDLVVYVSKYAWDNVGWKLSSSCPKTKFNFTCHPGDARWWHRKDYKHQVKKFRRILSEHFMTASTANAA